MTQPYDFKMSLEEAMSTQRAIRINDLIAAVNSALQGCSL